MNITPEFLAYVREHGLSVGTSEALRSAHAAFVASVSGKPQGEKKERTPQTYVAVRVSDLSVISTGSSGDCRAAAVADSMESGDLDAKYLIVTADDWETGRTFGTAMQVAADGRGRPAKKDAAPALNA